jgi:glycosyltransferase involved in cell wall biosynthesis
MLLSGHAERIFGGRENNRMRVAIVHYWLVSMRGGEKVLESLCQLFQKPIFLPMSRSDTSPRGAACRHSPMRYVWNMYHDYRERTGWLRRFVMPPICHYVRIWDAAASMRVDRFIANSATVAERIEKYYRREPVVIHPPVSVEFFESVPASEVEDYYLMAGELVVYKRPELAVEAFNALGRRLIIIGGGEMLADVRKRAGPTVTVMGPQPFGVLRHHYAHCRALVFPGEEDFGIVPVEVMASGRPVIAYGRGGATETVTPGVSGLFFKEQTAAAIERAVQDFERMRFDPLAIKAQASKFNANRFMMEFTAAVENAIGRKIDSPVCRESKAKLQSVP